MVPDPESRAGSSPKRKGGKNGQQPPSKIPHPISLIIDPKIFSMALKTCIAILATVGFATAQTSVVSLFIPDTDPQPLAASLVAQGAGTTTYSINCPPGTDGSDCGMGPGMWYTSGPKTVEWAMSDPADGFWGRIVCSMGGTTTAVCTEMMSGTGANFPGTSTGHLAQSDITLIPVTVTAGPTSTASASTTTDLTGSTSTSSSSNVHATGGTASSASAASSTIVASHTSTGGLSRVTGNPCVVFGGAAAAFIAAAL
ncbi:uncharacterized protein N7458_008897 [Penicillium daleae]|uniref:GPI anchored protein n=1 Tax=Penicillium daleae TaxID=63821 RepID=A0AAD6BVV7_9EURO|nr:uncharacterized protein N7458_008897 [Penicillium daleae]KAJ5437899.1 hypothetical protein N7458_008897 [Penicillium daleae]